MSSIPFFIDFYEELHSKAFETLQEYLTSWGNYEKRTEPFNVIKVDHDLILQIPKEDMGDMAVTLRAFLEGFQCNSDSYRITPFLADTLSQYLRMLLAAESSQS